ncbi:12147_t:CDS:1 [Cetraspora pellucida]|uniref:12147_t:CDS:1 n=1 Tax=Cetraspora pellucida TaxID=1433469 RepID=A0ACA9LII3_9GLOM|nr:12147_t:CDS:1 [Cetraspora pellucida]
MSKNNFVIEDSEREVISVLILKSEFYDDIIEIYKKWLLNEESNDNEYYKRLYQLFDDRKNEDHEDDEKKLSLIDDILNLVQKRELKRRSITEECIKNINSLRQTFGFYPIKLGDQSIKVTPSEQEIIFENKDRIYDNFIMEYKSWFSTNKLKLKNIIQGFLNLLKKRKMKITIQNFAG